MPFPPFDYHMPLSDSLASEKTGAIPVPEKRRQHEKLGANGAVKAEKYRLRNELHAKSVIDPVPDFARQSQNVFGVGSASIDQSKRVLRGETRRSKRIAFRKSGVLNQPCCGGFYFAGSRRITRDTCPCAQLEVCKLSLTDDRILEKGSCAPAIRIALD